MKLPREHGTMRGYGMHYTDGTEVCAECKEASRLAALQVRRQRPYLSGHLFVAGETYCECGASVDPDDPRDARRQRTNHLADIRMAKLEES